MSEHKIQFFKQAPDGAASAVTGASGAIADEPSTCTDAEPFALRVLDKSMEPEFRKGCIIVIDPTGRATDGSYVLVEKADEMLFRQLVRSDSGGWLLEALNDQYPSTAIDENLSEIVGVIVQRAGLRRSYHKRYD